MPCFKERGAMHMGSTSSWGLRPRGWRCLWLCRYGTSQALSCCMRMLAQMCCMLIISAGNALLQRAGVPCTWVLPAAGGFALGAEDARGCDSVGFCEPVLPSVLHLLPDVVDLSTEKHSSLEGFEMNFSAESGRTSGVLFVSMNRTSAYRRANTVVRSLSE